MLAWPAINRSAPVTMPSLPHRLQILDAMCVTTKHGLRQLVVKAIVLVLLRCSHVLVHMATLPQEQLLTSLVPLNSRLC